MIKQIIILANPSSLSLRNNQMVISPNDNDEVVTRPIEDIGVVIVQNQRTHISVPLINALALNNVMLIYCDAKSMPSCCVLPYCGNSTMQEVCHLQIESSITTNKRAWKEIIEHKIKNQSQLLIKYNKDGAMLRPFYNNVLSGDTSNREAVAAKLYWTQLFGQSFTRCRNGNGINALLNYGYSILRSAVARAIVGSGLLPVVGIHHRNRYNAFALADDLMEPYRPFVDDIVVLLYKQGNLTLNNETKANLTRVLLCDVKINSKTSPLLVALSTTTASLVKLYKEPKFKLLLPQFI